MRRQIIAGNWKMNKTVEEARALVQDLTPRVAALGGVDIVVCPPYTALFPVRQALAGTNIALGAQDVFWKPSGAYTGQVSVPMLADLGVHYVIVGHSETRGRFGVPEKDLTPEQMRHFGETDGSVNLKVRAALAGGLVAIVCVGETLDERQQGKTDEIVRGQAARALEGVDAAQAGAHVVFAYEPVWAIGTGEVCRASEADRICGLIRSTVGGLYGTLAAESIRVQYGGSMKPDNAAELLAQPNIDGGLIGGASLKAADFAAIIEAASDV